MIVLRLRRVGVIDRLAFRHDMHGVRRLHEEEGRLAGRVAPHLAGMRRVIAPDAIDAADRESVGGARDRYLGALRFGDDGGHGFPWWVARLLYSGGRGCAIPPLARADFRREEERGGASHEHPCRAAPGAA